VLAFMHLDADLRQVRVNAGGLRIENGSALIKGGIGPVGHPMGAHALSEFRHVVLDLLVHSLGRCDAGTAVWEEVPTGLGGSRVLGAARRALDLGLGPHSSAIGVWEVRDSVGAHASREGERAGVN